MTKAEPINRPGFYRLAWLIKKFVEANRPLTGLELANEFEVSRKTLERDIELLRNMGFEIVCVKAVGCHGLAGRKMQLPAPCPFCSKPLGPKSALITHHSSLATSLCS